MGRKLSVLHRGGCASAVEEVAEDEREQHNEEFHNLNFDSSSKDLSDILCCDFVFQSYKKAKFCL